jgi:transposase-like protein
MEIQKPSRRRRHHPEEFKQAVIEACCEPGASVAGIAMANGVNANQVRRWMRERGIEAPKRRMSMSARRQPEFVQLPLAPRHQHRKTSGSKSGVATPRSRSTGRSRHRAIAQPGYATGCDDPGRCLVALNPAAGHAGRHGNNPGPGRSDLRRGEAAPCLPLCQPTR